MPMQHLGVDSRIVGRDEIRELAPLLDMREGKDLPVLAGLYHPPGGVIRHDAVIWAYARGADRKGAEIHPFTEITRINRSNGRVTGVETNQGTIQTDMVVNCTAAWASSVATMVGLDLPMVTHPSAGDGDGASEAVAGHRGVIYEFPRLCLPDRQGGAGDRWGG